MKKNRIDALLAAHDLLRSHTETGYDGTLVERSEWADERGPWHHIPDIFARRTDGSALLLDVKHPARLDDEPVRLQAPCPVSLGSAWRVALPGRPRSVPPG
jgi:hypothetical protein